MRILRTVGAALAWVLATVLLVLAVVLSITVVLLPVGILLGFASMHLYRLGLKWALPRASDVARATRTQARRWRRDPAVRKLRHAFSAGKPQGRKRRIRLPRRRGRKRGVLRNLGRSG